MLLVGASASYDSNIFRLADGVEPRTAQGKSSRYDRISTGRIGLRVDKPYAQQRFLVDITVSAVRHDYYSYLDYEPLEYRAAWQWTFTPRTMGTLSASRSESLVNYADFNNITQRNLRITEDVRADGDSLLFGGWHAVAALSYVRGKNEVDFVDQPSSQTAGFEGGVKYVTLARNTVKLTQRTLQGDYTDRPLDPVNLIDDGFLRSETELTASWLATAKSSFDGRVAWIYYRADHFSERDFSGPAYRLGYRWTPGARLALDLAVSRDLESFQNNRASYTVTRRLSLGASWQFAARTTLRASSYYGDTSYRQPVVPLVLPAREDQLYGGQLSADWRMWRNLTMSASLQRDRRTSNDPTSQYSATLATLGLSLLF